MIAALVELDPVGVAAVILLIVLLEIVAPKVYGRRSRSDRPTYREPRL
jgi:hypothetical protein